MQQLKELRFEVEKISGLEGIRAHDVCDSGALPCTELQGWMGAWPIVKYEVVSAQRASCMRPLKENSNSALNCKHRTIDHFTVVCLVNVKSAKDHKRNCFT